MIWSEKGNHGLMSKVEKESTGGELSREILNILGNNQKSLLQSLGMERYFV